MNQDCGDVIRAAGVIGGLHQLLTRLLRYFGLLDSPQYLFFILYTPQAI